MNLNDAFLSICVFSMRCRCLGVSLGVIALSE